MLMALRLKAFFTKRGKHHLLVIFYCQETENLSSSSHGFLLVGDEQLVVKVKGNTVEATQSKGGKRLSMLQRYLNFHQK